MLLSFRPAVRYFTDIDGSEVAISQPPQLSNRFYVAIEDKAFGEWEHCLFYSPAVGLTLGEFGE